MNRKQKWAYAIVCLLALAYLASPYVSLAGLYLAIKGADQVALLDRVDWQSLRRGFKDDFNRVARTEAGAMLGAATGDKGATVTLSWRAMPLADEIAAVLATPKGLIAMFDQPATIRCVLKGLAAGGDRRSGEDCLKSVPPQGETRHFTVRGPNLRRWFEKRHYAFFTNPFTFRFEVAHEGMRVVLVLERRGMGWQLARLTIPFEQVLRQRTDQPAPSGGKG